MTKRPKQKTAHEMKLAKIRRRSKFGLGNPLTSLTFTEMVPMARVDELTKKVDLARTDLTTLARAVRDLQTRGDDKTSALSENVRQLGQEMTTAQSDILKIKRELAAMDKQDNEEWFGRPRGFGPTTAEEKDKQIADLNGLLAGFRKELSEKNLRLAAAEGRIKILEGERNAAQVRAGVTDFENAELRRRAESIQDNKDALPGETWRVMSERLVRERDEAHRTISTTALRVAELWKKCVELTARMERERTRGGQMTKIWEERVNYWRATAERYLNELIALRKK